MIKLYSDAINDLLCYRTRFSSFNEVSKLKNKNMYTIQKENKMHVILNIYLLLTLVMDIYILKINFDDALIDPSSKNIVSLIITLLDIFLQ